VCSRKIVQRGCEEGGGGKEINKNKEDIAQGKVMFQNKKQLLSSNNPSLEREEKLVNSLIRKVALYGLEIWTLGKNEEGLKCI